MEEVGALPSARDKRQSVRTMFDRIAPRYDRMNRLLTGGLDQRWRARALEAIAVGPGDTVVDLACGTGDLAELVAARGARAIGVDFAPEMLRGAARRRIPALLVQADGARLPLDDGCASAFTCGFALRNFVSLPEIFDEMARVLASAGRFAFIEVDRPRHAALRALHSLYFDRVVPRVGALLSDRAAYAYLPQSTAYLPPEAELLAQLAKSGFERLHKTPLLLGAAQIVTGART